MILRIPDYFHEFSCIADKCKDSCCIGWEIDIDEYTCEYYRQQEGPLGERMRKHLYKTSEGDYSFSLVEKGRCPFLNQCNLCDIVIELGEESLSEVCTEYPRFSIEYGDVLQKCLSLSCEEVGRILFSKETPVVVCEEGIPEEELWEGEDADFIEWAHNLEMVQEKALHILQDRTRPLAARIREYLMGTERLFPLGEAEESLSLYVEEDLTSGEEAEAEEDPLTLYECFLQRLEPFLEMETLNSEWRNQKKAFRDIFNENSYPQILSSFMESPDYQEKDYEQLLVYFTFRYLMNAVYNYDALSYAKMAVLFTLMIRDMDAIRFYQNGNSFSREDRIDVARIFSKEVEHSQDNVELARESVLFMNDHDILAF